MTRPSLPYSLRGAVSVSRVLQPARLAALAAAIVASTAAADCGTVECWSDPAVGTACKCTQGATPPSCVDLGSCLAECPG